jgi:hypothetical protein
MIFQLLLQQGWTLPVMYRAFCYTLIMAVSLFAANANGAPMAYSVNSDSGDDIDTDDSLYEINLENGQDEHIVRLFTGTEYRTDTEGLAFAPGGQLWGIDDGPALYFDGFPTLFPISEKSGFISYLDEIKLKDIPPPIDTGHDFGMTFACDGTLFVTSVNTDTLYRVNVEDGSSEIAGSKGAGALGANISAIAAIGNPTRLYGLENGNEASPGLYSINVDTGATTKIMSLDVGGLIAPYNEAGLAFDGDGNLWAITDRSLFNKPVGEPSQILSIDLDAHTATPVGYTTEIGFESLAIAPPTDCAVKAARDEEEEEDDPRIPTLGPGGLLLAVLALMFSGMTILRRRIS